MVVMFYASIGIPLNVVFHCLLGDTITKMIAKLIHRVEYKLLKRRRVHKLPVKVFFLSSLANVVFLNLSCILISVLLTPKLSYIDSMYYWFQTVTTIGYGDVYPDYIEQGSIRSVLLTAITGILFLFGIGLTSSLVAAIVKYLDSLKAKQLRVALSSFSIRKKKMDKYCSGEVIDDINMTTACLDNSERLRSECTEKQSKESMEKQSKECMEKVSKESMEKLS